MPITEGGKFSPVDRIVSPGVFTRENDLSGVAQGVAEIGAVVLAPFPKYDANNVKGGIGYKEGQNRRFKNGFQVENYVYNISAAGRIYETAGRLNPQGRAPFTSILIFHGAQLTFAIPVPIVYLVSSVIAGTELFSVAENVKSKLYLLGWLAQFVGLTRT